MSPKHPHRMTKQRRVILEELQNTVRHPTADELHRQVRRRLPSISLGTVYRNLETLADLGVIQKLELAGEPMRFDGTTATHYHVRCLKCGRVDDVPLAPLSDMHRLLEGICGYHIVSHNLEFVGVCPECKQGPDEQVEPVSGGMPNAWELPARGDEEGQSGARPEETAPPELSAEHLRLPDTGDVQE